jgi:hypothetical protein
VRREKEEKSGEASERRRDRERRERERERETLAERGTTHELSEFTCRNRFMSLE